MNKKTKDIAEGFTHELSDNLQARLKMIIQTVPTFWCFGSASNGHWASKKREFYS